MRGHRVDIADCFDSSELNRHLDYLTDEKQAENSAVANLALPETERTSGSSHPSGSPARFYSPTIKGWQAVEPASQVGGEPGRCFVAMSFDDSLDSVFARGVRDGDQGMRVQPLSNQGRSHK